MPTSSSEGKDIIRGWVNDFSSTTHKVLDLGVGEGTYYKLFTKKKFGRILSEAYWIGIEAWKPYIEKYDLNSKYNVIINEDIRTVDYNMLGNIDLTFAGDVLEHMSKDEAITVINNVLKISKKIIISIPIVHYPQDDIEENPFEIHIKDDWSHEEVLQTFANITDSWKGNTIGVYLITS